MDWFKRRPNTAGIIDVRGDPKYRGIDIDFILQRIDGSECPIEVKTDQYRSQNIFYETVSAVETNSLGCMHKSKAKYLAYYFINDDKLYIIELKQFNDWMRKLIAEHCPVAEFKQFKNKRFDDSKYTSQGYTLPLKYLEYNFPEKYLQIEPNITGIKEVAADEEDKNSKEPS